MTAGTTDTVKIDSLCYPQHNSNRRQNRRPNVTIQNERLAFRYDPTVGVSVDFRTMNTDIGQHSNALRFQHEPQELCCASGKVKLPQFTLPSDCSDCWHWCFLTRNHDRSIPWRIYISTIVPSARHHSGRITSKNEDLIRLLRIIKKSAPVHTTNPVWNILRNKSAHGRSRIFQLLYLKNRKLSN